WPLVGWLRVLCAVVVLRFDCVFFFFFQAEDGIRDDLVTGVQTCALPISAPNFRSRACMSGPPVETGRYFSSRVSRHGCPQRIQPSVSPSVSSVSTHYTSFPWMRAWRQVICSRISPPIGKGFGWRTSLVTSPSPCDG